LALCLGIWKYQQVATNENHLAHPYVDTAHRAALLYSFATLLVAGARRTQRVCDLSEPNAIVAYIVHGIRRDTTNQFEDFDVPKHISMWLLIVGEIGGFAVLLAGFVAGQFF
jgi:hypothetical protein